MKKLILLFILSLGLGMADAQTKKAVAKPAVKKEQPIASSKEQTLAEAKGPTKEQTIQYISNIFKSADASKHVYEVKFEDCTMNISQLDSKSGELKEKLSVPLNNIEEVGVTGVNGTPNMMLYFRPFTEVDAYHIKCYWYYRRVDGGGEYICDFNPETLGKLTKAFNHLRKLCGAPEPISFD